MEALPFATKPHQGSSWGFGGINILKSNMASPSFCDSSPASSSEPSRNCTPDNKYDEFMPAVLLNNLKKDKKPFTYTPGRVDLSEVLNAKLQKRLSRKKVRSPKPITDDPTKQVLVMPTYNTPLNMYSMENALEALEVQAELTVKDKSIDDYGSMTLPRNYKFEAKDFEPKNVTQSKAFRVLQIITDTEETENEGPKKTNNVPLEEHQKFSGLRDSGTIPSKLFHNLQKITNTDSDNITYGNKGHKANMTCYEDEQRFSGMREHSAIPSKMFHNLQKITHTEPINNVNQVNKALFYTKPAEHENSFIVPKFQASNCNGVGANPILKRPAAFLPSKSQVMPVTKYTDRNIMRGSSNKVLRPYEGTDF